MGRWCLTQSSGETEVAARGGRFSPPASQDSRTKGLLSQSGNTHPMTLCRRNGVFSHPCPLWWRRLEVGERRAMVRVCQRLCTRLIFLLNETGVCFVCGCRAQVWDGEGEVICQEWPGRSTGDGHAAWVWILVPLLAGSGIFGRAPSLCLSFLTCTM